MDQYVHFRRQSRDVFEMRYQETIDSDTNRWELCSRVLSRRDVEIGFQNPGDRGMKNAIRTPLYY